MRGLALAVAVVAAVAAAAISGWVAPAGADPPTGTVPSYGVTPDGSQPTGIVGGPDGNLWFVQSVDFGGSADEIGRLTPAGTLTEFPVADANARPLPPLSITSVTGNTGALFFTEATSADLSALAQISTAGEVTQTSVARLAPTGTIASDSSGDIWIPEPSRGAVVEVEPPYTAADEPIPLPLLGAYPTSIAAGPDGQTMWFTDAGTGSIGSIGPGRTVHEYQLSTVKIGAPLKMSDIVLGPDGNLWVGVEQVVIASGPVQLGLELGLGGLPQGAAAAPGGPDWLVRITGSGDEQGTLTAFPLPSDSNADPLVLGAGPDGQMWMADFPGNGGDLTAATTAAGSSETFTDYAGVLATNASISSITKDPGGADALWMTDVAGNSVERVALQPPSGPSGPSGPTGSSGPSGPDGSGSGGGGGPSGPSGPTGPSVPASSAAPPELTARLAPASDVSRTGAVLHGTITLPDGSAPTPATYRFEYGPTTAYGSQTSAATETVSPEGLAVSASVSGLEAYTTYHFRLLARDCASQACEAESTDRTFTTGSTLRPSEHVSEGVEPTSGVILVELPGHHRFKRLTKGELVPLGTTIDARNGGVLVESATGGGEQASGRFTGGIFELTQPRHGSNTVLVLESKFAVCAGAQPAKTLAHAASGKKKPRKKRRSHKVVNQVFGNAHGQFATQGQYATAADQGTSWRVSDRCDGTQIAVSSGKVVVTDFARHRKFVLKGGHSYLAPGH